MCFPYGRPNVTASPRVQLLSRDQYVLDTPDDPDDSTTLREPLTGVTIHPIRIHIPIILFAFTDFFYFYFFPTINARYSIFFKINFNLPLIYSTIQNIFLLFNFEIFQTYDEIYCQCDFSLNFVKKFTLKMHIFMPINLILLFLFFFFNSPIDK